MYTEHRTAWKVDKPVWGTQNPSLSACFGPGGDKIMKETRKDLKFAF